MTSHRLLLLFPWGGISWLKCYFLRPLTGLRARLRRRIQSQRGKKINNIYFYNLFDRIQIGNRFVCCDNVCWVRGSQTVSPSGVLNVYEAIDSFSPGLCKHDTLPYPVGPAMCSYGLRKTLSTWNFPTCPLTIICLKKLNKCRPIFLGSLVFWCRV